MAKVTLAAGDRKVIGKAWIKNQIRPIYDRREISKGKRKGQWMVWYLAQSSEHGLILRKLIVKAEDLILIPVEEMK